MAHQNMALEYEELFDKFDINLAEWNNTVDGRNPAPVDMANIPWFAGFHASQVVQDFFHQQYFTNLGLIPEKKGKSLVLRYLFFGARVVWGRDLIWPDISTHLKQTHFLYKLQLQHHFGFFWIFFGAKNKFHLFGA